MGRVRSLVACADAKTVTQNNEGTDLKTGRINQSSLAPLIP